jgi:hypothetical protein
VHDAPLFHYIAWLLDRGVMPYRDLVDMNWPGTYLVHLAVLHTVGPGDLAWRGFDLAWLVASGALLFAYLRPLAGAGAGAAGGLLFTVYHLAGGSWLLGQRDFLLCVFLLAGALGVARFAEGGGAMGSLAWGGLALGAGASIKPQAVLYAAVCVALAALAARPAGRPAWVAAGVLAAGVTAVPAALFAWLAWQGALEPFATLFTGYVMPLYSRVARVSPLEGLSWHAHAWQILTLLAALTALGVVATRRRGRPVRQALVLAGIAYGWAHYWLQGKGWEYHLYPLFFFLCAGAALALAPVDATAWRVPALGRAVRPAVAVLLFAPVLALLGVRGADAAHAGWIDAKMTRIARLTRDLGAVVPPGAPVQVLDVTAGGIHAALRLGLPPATRFMYDFHFFHHVTDPRIRAMRAELVAGLAGGRAAAVVVMEDGWPVVGYQRLHDFPALEDVLARDYVLVVEGDGYRIHARRRA